MELDFGHFARSQIAGKWQTDESCVEGMLEAIECRDVYNVPQKWTTA